MTTSPPCSGCVYIIGAGPGDPELITIKGFKALRKCSIVFYDATVAQYIIDHCRPDAERVRLEETLTDNPALMEEVNARIIAAAQAGHTVGLVQEGDPFIFGLGAETARAAARHQIPFYVIPGITSAIAAAAYAGIPLTYRGYSSTVAFATGHTDLNKKYTDVDWAKVATGVSTLVVFMGLDNLRMIVQKMIEHGRDPRTPTAIVCCGTTPQQHTIAATLGEIARRVEENELAIRMPAIIIIGDVVGLHEELRWFEKPPAEA
ncbi:MAG: uroporphyrinogen-III C-methyltransferase [bacterium]|nr:uroporphyrinogen-III C-methyltransferase [bacterium]